MWLENKNIKGLFIKAVKGEAPRPGKRVNLRYVCQTKFCKKQKIIIGMSEPEGWLVSETRGVHCYDHSFVEAWNVPKSELYDVNRTY